MALAPIPVVFGRSLPRLCFALAVAVLGAGVAQAESPVAVAEGASPRNRATGASGARLLKSKSMLSEKQERRVLSRCDRLAISFYLSEPGRFLSGPETDEDFRSAARYAARKVLSSQLEALKPEILDSWRESAVGLRSREAHGGEVDATKKKFDLDVGLRSGRPFLGTNLASTRITFEWDWRRDTAKLSATRRFGDLSTRLELRHEDDGPELRVNFGIPVSW